MEPHFMSESERVAYEEGLCADADESNPYTEGSGRYEAWEMGRAISAGEIIF